MQNQQLLTKIVISHKAVKLTESSMDKIIGILCKVYPVYKS